MKKIKILIVPGAMDMGGLENQLMHLIRNADSIKFQIDYTSTKRNPYYKEEIESLGGKCLLISGTEGYHFIHYCKELYRIIKEGDYDVVHSHELFHSGLVLLTAKLAGVKLRIAHAHSSNQNYGRNYIRHLYNSVMRQLILHYGNMFLACSSVAAEFLYGKRIFNNPNYHLVVNSVETSKFVSSLPDGEINEYALRSWKNVLQVGRFAEEKNYLFTCEIAASLKKKGRRIRILCVGNNGENYEKKVRTRIEELEIQDYMILLGVRKDVDLLMKKVDAFLLPSIYEGMPLTLIEAQASGLPCVVSDRFSHEVDYNIGLLHWLKLESGSEEWADELSKAVVQNRPNHDNISAAIKANGFDVKDFTKTVCGYYELTAISR